MTDAPVCPLHKKAMVPVEVQADIDYKCSQDECPIRWSPATRVYYLRSRRESTSPSNEWAE